MPRLDIIVYGATGFTGHRVVSQIATSTLFQGLTFGVAGRSESKLRKVLADVSDETGKNVRDVPIILASTDDEDSLDKMCSQAVVIINTVGPYRLHGEPVVAAAVRNGASHVDVSGEPAFLERMQLTYGEEAKKKGVYVVGACGWDSVPADLGSNFLKKNFNGDLAYIESFVQLNTGPAGYSFNAGTYQTLILGISSAVNDKLGAIRRQIMSEKIPKSTVRAPKRGQLWKINEPELKGWALPFPGSDKSIINRTQYYQYVEEHERPFHIETYIRVSSFIWTALLALWVTVFAIFVMFKPTRSILQKYPDQCSFNLFKNSGPTKEQMEQASFIYWFFGHGYEEKKKPEEEHEGKPTKKVVVTCRGPDAGYIATSGCILSCALAIIRDKDTLPKDGGVFTTASAFAHTKIYEYLDSFGVSFQVEPTNAKL